MKSLPGRQILPQLLNTRFYNCGSNVKHASACSRAVDPPEGSGDSISMIRKQARLGGYEFKRASLDMQGNTLTDHVQGHNKAKAIS
jgi:hypothetical protein